MKTKQLTQGAVFCASYVTLCHLQNLLLPGSASFVIQVRAAEAMCVLAFFTPSAIWSLTLGCLLFNFTYAAALPLDIPLGTLATFLSVGGMYLTRNIKARKLPLLGLSLPVIFNGLLVGGELTYYFGGGFLLNVFYVAVGEGIALILLGSSLYFALEKRKSLFS